MAPDWKDGCRTEITVSGELVDSTMSSLENGMKYARGYYRFSVQSQEESYYDADQTPITDCHP